MALTYLRMRYRRSQSLLKSKSNGTSMASEMYPGICEGGNAWLAARELDVNGASRAKQEDYAARDATLAAGRNI